jgi:hypothetical protein
MEDKMTEKSIAIFNPSRIKSIISLMFITLAMVAQSCVAFEGNYNLDTYVGVDTKIRRMEFKRNFGNKIFKDPFYKSLNVFVGCKMNQYFGIEVGYELSNTKINSKYSANGTFLFGNRLIDNVHGFDSVVNYFQSRSMISGFNINMMGFLPLNEKKNLNIIGSIGFANLRSKTKCDLFEIGQTNVSLNDQHNISVQRFAHTKSQYKNRKVTIRLNTGIQYLINRNFGIRALAGWENTHKIKIQGKDRVTGIKVNEHAKFKDSITYRIGFFVPF